MLGNHRKTGHGLNFLFPKIGRAMFFYLDESYNLQKKKGELFVSINGFVIEQNQKLRSQWIKMRKPYAHGANRIHANNPIFEAVRPKSLDLLFKHQAVILSVVQSVSALPPVYFNKKGLLFEKVYLELTKTIIREAISTATLEIKIILDSRGRKGRKTAEEKFKAAMNDFFLEEFLSIQYTFNIVPSYVDILLELADFVSNSVYRRYRGDLDRNIFDFKQNFFRQIKNPL